MPPLRMRTLRDLQETEEEDEDPEMPISSSSKKVPLTIVRHIPNLPDSDACLSLLTRIHKEFYPIIQRRGYRVVSLSEMCCCGDGLDHLHHTTSGSNRRGKPRRKLKVMPSKVLGYNCTRSSGGGRSKNKVHTIHLRLRHAQNHASLYSYEEVAGTMAHELAHCVHGPHNAAFYKLMDQILDQHALFLTRGIVADRDGFPLNSEQAYTLGVRGASQNNNNAAPARNKASVLAEAAQRRQQHANKWMPQGPQVLGGDAGFRNWLAPREAARQAAEARRMRDEQWCQPCQEANDHDDDVIELLSSSDSEDDDDHDDGDANKKPAATLGNDSNAKEGCKSVAAAAATSVGVGVSETEPGKSKVLPPSSSSSTRPIAISDAASARSTSVVTIDLTTSDDNEEEKGNHDRQETNAMPNHLAALASSHDVSRRKRRASDNAAADSNNDRKKWSCSTCTFVNEADTLACAMCGKEPSRALECTERVVAQIRRKDEMDHMKRAEVEQSRRDFGFNIYGNGRHPSSKLPHLT